MRWRERVLTGANCQGVEGEAEREGCVSLHPLFQVLKLKPHVSDIHFIADDKGAFTSGVGMLFDASGLLGAPRSKVRRACLQR